jgi:hypothetical protein
MSTRELIDALATGDSIAIEDSFNNAMSQKISSALDSYRTQVAQNMFNSAEDTESDLEVESEEQPEDADTVEA